MSGILDLIKLVAQIIKSPVKTIKGIAIISYDRDAMLRLFSLTSSIYLILEFSFRYNRLNLGIILLVGILAPFLMFLAYNIAAVLYYAAFKLLGKDIKANYDAVKKALYPVFLTLMILNIFILFIARIIPAINTLLQYAANLWLYAMIFFLLKYKLNQTTSRSILISLTPIFITVIMTLVLIAVRL
ncbi:MAG: hypothetical protein K0R84_248 [Clostridia bacterium]|jgi:hypothetical protein|nr:hypothetical protein [Clostridia bacterium]